MHREGVTCMSHGQQPLIEYVINNVALKLFIFPSSDKLLFSLF